MSIDGQQVVVSSIKEEKNYGAILEARREACELSRGQVCEFSEKLEAEDPLRFKSFSPGGLWGWENDVTGLRIGRANNKTLRTLAYILGWNNATFKKQIGHPIGPVPRIDHDRQAHFLDFVERYGFQYHAGVRLPVFGSVAAGIEGFESAEEPDEFQIFDPRELPAGASPRDLYLVYANGNSMYEVDMVRAIPNGSKLVVHHRAAPEDNQVVVAYIPERDIGVVKQFKNNRDETGVMLRSFQNGGPCFMATEYPSMYVSGVVRRLVIDL